MRKKLYKTKKNWVIGLIAGTIFCLGNIATISADSNMKQPIVGSASKAMPSPTKYGTSDMVMVNGEQSSNNTQKQSPNYQLSNNISISTQSHNLEGLVKNPGFSYTMQAKGVPTLHNDEDVSFKYYHHTDHKLVNIDAPGYDINNKSVAATDAFSGYAADSNQPGVLSNEWNGKVNIGNRKITIVENNNYNLYPNLNSTNTAKMVRTITVKGNEITNNIHINASGEFFNGSWGIEIEPDWADDNFESNFWQNNKMYFPYKLGNIFYYVIKTRDNKPRWIEIIRPLDGNKMFTGATRLGPTEPIMGGNLLLGYKDGDYLIPNRMFMIAPSGLNANFGYKEIYYKINRNNVQKHYTVTFIDGLTNKILETNNVEKGDNIKTPSGYVLSDGNNQINNISSNKKFLVYKQITVQLVNNKTQTLIGDQLKVIMNGNYKEQILRTFKGKYQLVFTKSGAPKAKIIKGITYLYVEPFEYKQIGDEDLTKDNTTFEADKIIDKIKDDLTDELGDKIGDTIAKIGKLGTDISLHGFDEDKIEEAIGVASDLVHDWAETVINSKGLTDKENTGWKKVSGLFKNISGLGMDVFDDIKYDGQAFYNEEEASHKYVHNRTKKNFEERKKAFEKTRNKQMEGIYSKFKTIIDTAKNYATIQKIPEVITGMVVTALTLVFVFLVKNIWGVLDADKMSGIFGLKLHNITNDKNVYKTIKENIKNDVHNWKTGKHSGNK